MSERRETLVLTHYALKRPWLVLALLTVFCAFGVYSYLDLGVDLFPRVRFPLVTATFTDPGESPEGIIEKIVVPVESSLESLPGIKHVHSTVVPGAAVITAVFKEDSLSGQPERDVRKAVNSLSGILPKGIAPPQIHRKDLTRSPLMWIILPLPEKTSSMKDEEVQQFVFREFLPRIRRVRGIQSVHVVAPPPVVMHVYLSAKKMAAFGLSPDSVSLQLRERSREYPAGALSSSDTSLTLDVRGNPLAKTGLESFHVLLPSGRTVPLSSIARISEGPANSSTIFRFEGKPAIALKLYPVPGSNMIRLSGRIRNLLRGLEKGTGPRVSVPSDFRPTIRMDRSKPIEQNNKELLETLMIGAALAVLVILVFLGNFRETGVAALAIPASVLLTFPFLHFFRFTLNNLTMLGLSLVVGILIDDAIVVLENIHRHRSLGQSPLLAARRGVGEIGRAVLATTFSIVAVFAPMAMMHGVLGEFFREFGWTVSFAVLASLLISLTVSPSLIVLGAEGRIQEQRHLFAFAGGWGGSVKSFYRNTLEHALHHPVLVTVCCLLLLGGTLAMGKTLGWNLIPGEDQNAFTVHLRLDGSPSLARTDRTASDIASRIMALPGVRSLFQQVGGTQGVPPSEGYLYVSLSDRSERTEPDTEIMEKTRAILAGFPALKGSVDALSPLGGTGASTPFACFLMGGDPKVLASLSEKLQEAMRKIPGVRDVNSSRAGSLKIIMVRPKPSNPPEWGISSGRIAQWIAQMSTSYSAGFVETSHGRRSLVVSVDPLNVASLPAISDLPFPVGLGKILPLSTIATIDREMADQRMSRDDRRPSITITANLHGSTSLGEVMKKVNEWAKANLVSPYRIRYAGNSDVLNDARGQIAMAVTVGIFVVYGLLSFLFGSLILPFVIMISIPFSLVGAILGLWISGVSVNMMGAIGLIILFGLVTKNAILLVDYANTLIRRGRSVREAVLESAAVRLRPIAMTTLAMVFGMAPMAVGWGAGGQVRQSMAVVVIGGLISSMFFTLFLVPVVYERLSLVRRPMGREEENPS